MCIRDKSVIIFHNTQVWIYDAHNVVLKNISVIVENKRVGSGVGTTTIRHGSTNVTVSYTHLDVYKRQLLLRDILF